MAPRRDGLPKRRDGVDGWTKGGCWYSPTGWGWWRDNGCTCQPCQPPRKKGAFTAVDHTGE